MLKPMSPALAGRFLTTGPPGKSLVQIFITHTWKHIEDMASCVTCAVTQVQGKESVVSVCGL